VAGLGPLPHDRAAFIDQPVDAVDPRALRRDLAHVDLRRVVGAQHDRLDAGAAGISGERGAGIAVGRHGDLGDAELLGHRHRHDEPARLERAGRQPPLILDQQFAQAERAATVSSRTIGVAASPRLTMFAADRTGNSSRHRHMSCGRPASASRVSDPRTPSRSYRTNSGRPARDRPCSRSASYRSPVIEHSRCVTKVGRSAVRLSFQETVMVPA
jgi:hypothetical protein